VLIVILYQYNNNVLRVMEILRQLQLVQGPPTVITAPIPAPTTP
jgi:hypothetical protein